MILQEIHVQIVMEHAKLVMELNLINVHLVGETMF